MTFLAGTRTTPGSSVLPPAVMTDGNLRLPRSVVLGVLGLTPSPPSRLMVRVVVVRMGVVVRVVVVVRVMVQRFLLAVYTAHVVMMTESKLSAVPPHTCTSPSLQLSHRASDKSSVSQQKRLFNISANI